MSQLQAGLPYYQWLGHHRDQRMPIEEDIGTRLQQLLDDSTDLSLGTGEYGQCKDDMQMQKCSAWLTSAQNLVHLICSDPDAPYRQKADRVALRGHGYRINAAVGEVAAVLAALQIDGDSGLLVSVADRARAETFDDFLDHAYLYLQDNRKREAGAIAGVVFEDALRRVCRKNAIIEKERPIDELISTLSSKGEISAIKAKRARAAAHIRTKATHAQWDEFELDDVRATIEFTRELIVSKLDV